MTMRLLRGTVPRLLASLLFVSLNKLDRKELFGLSSCLDEGPARVCGFSTVTKETLAPSILGCTVLDLLTKRKENIIRPLS